MAERTDLRQACLDRARDDVEAILAPTVFSGALVAALEKVAEWDGTPYSPFGDAVVRVVARELGVTSE